MSASGGFVITSYNTLETFMFRAIPSHAFVSNIDYEVQKSHVNMKINVNYSTYRASICTLLELLLIIKVYKISLCALFWSRTLVISHLVSHSTLLGNNDN